MNTKTVESGHKYFVRQGELVEVLELKGDAMYVRHHDLPTGMIFKYPCDLPGLKPITEEEFLLRILSK